MGYAPNVLAHPTSAFIGVVVVDVWEWTPLMFLIILAGLQSIPQEPIEAARVDGAGPLRVFFDHTLPLLMPVLMVAVVLRTIDAIGTFDQIYVLTKGGPGTSTQLISTYAYNTAFLFTQYGRAMAMVVSLLVLTLLLMVVAIRYMRRVGRGRRHDPPARADGRPLRRAGAHAAGRLVPVLVDAGDVVEAPGRHLRRGRPAAPAPDRRRTTRGSSTPTTSARS